MDFKPNPAGLRALQQQIGDQVRDIVNRTSAETAEQDLGTAVDTLHRRLNAVSGLSFPREWSRNALETLRRGEPFQINIGS